MTLKELREHLGKIAKRMREMSDKINAERRDFSAEERTEWDRINKEYDQTRERIQATERTEQAERETRRRVDDSDVGREDTDSRRRREQQAFTEEQRSHAFRAWMNRQLGNPLTGVQRRACREMRFDPTVKVLGLNLWDTGACRQALQRMANVHPDLRQRELRAMSNQLGPSGGYLVAPASLVNNLEINLLAFGGVRQVADEITTETGEPLLWPTADDTSNQGEQLGENTQAISGSGQSVNPTLGQKRWDAYKFSSKSILVPTELLEDSQFDLPGLVGEMLGVRLGRVTAGKYATGSGASTPEGIVTGSALGVTAASATAIKPDEIYDLIHSVDPAYRGMPGVGFLLHDAILLYLRKLKDGEGRYIWQPGLQAGVPDRLANYPVNICQEMDSTVATTKKTILFGALGQYKIRRVKQARMYRLEERYRDTDQDGFICFIREDGKLLQAGTNPVKHLKQA